MSLIADKKFCHWQTYDSKSVKGKCWTTIPHIFAEKGSKDGSLWHGNLIVQEQKCQIDRIWKFISPNRQDMEICLADEEDTHVVQIPPQEFWPQVRSPRSVCAFLLSRKAHYLRHFFQKQSVNVFTKHVENWLELQLLFFACPPGSVELPGC